MNIIYWLILVGIIISKINLKKNGETYLWIAFYLFLAGSTTNILGLTNLAEVLMGICLVFLLSGFVFSVKEYYEK